MDHKILYVEDQVAHSIEDDLKRQGFNVVLNDSDDFNELFDVINQTEFDAYILDFRLTANKGRIDAPAIAQALRTEGVNHKKAPIILISNEEYLKQFDKDLTSQDLFDFAVSKKEFREKIDKYSKRINSFIKAYETIKVKEFKLDKILNISSQEQDKLIDCRLIEKISSDKIKDDLYAYCRFINISLIRGIGPLVGCDILAARLGIRKESKDWEALLALLDKCKYKGILSDVYDRWWMELILDWWNSISDGRPLRRSSAAERVNIIGSKLGLELEEIKPLNYAVSSNFWTICMGTKQALDPSEGYIINKKDIFPWQEMEYLSLSAALEQSEYREYLSQIDKNEIREFEKNGTL